VTLNFPQKVTGYFPPNTAYPGISHQHNAYFLLIKEENIQAAHRTFEIIIRKVCVRERERQYMQ